MKTLLLNCLFTMVALHCIAEGQSVSILTLLSEMTNLKRLVELSEHPYKYIQFSSYDRRSTGVSEPGWFSNSDGFGNEPVPGFDKVLKAPGENGIGEYLICDVKGPVPSCGYGQPDNGTIRLYLDGESHLFTRYAQAFFWETSRKAFKRGYHH
jgi:hypothetical protein